MQIQIKAWKFYELNRTNPAPLPYTRLEAQILKVQFRAACVVYCRKHIPEKFSFLFCSPPVIEVAELADLL
jgi:hypothetical protein